MDVLKETYEDTQWRERKRKMTYNKGSWERNTIRKQRKQKKRLLLMSEQLSVKENHTADTPEHKNVSVSRYNAACFTLKHAHLLESFTL